MRDWYPDELDTVGAEHTEADYVAGYDAKAQFDPTEDVELLRASGLDTASIVADIGAGTGVFARALAPHVGTVIAVDPSPAMARHLAARPVANVEVVRAGFLSWDRQPSSVDAVFSRNALHQLPDFWKVSALRRTAEVLRDGGLLRLRDLVFDFDPAEVDDAVEAWIAFAGDDPATGYTAREFVAHLRSEFSTFSWLLESMLERTGFEILDKFSTIGIYTAYTCRKGPS